MGEQQDKLAKFNENLMDNESSDEEGQENDEETPELVKIEKKKKAEKVIDEDGFEMVTKWKEEDEAYNW